jgi:hypothetical protein
MYVLNVLQTYKSNDSKSDKEQKHVAQLFVHRIWFRWHAVSLQNEFPRLNRTEKLPTRRM